MTMPYERSRALVHAGEWLNELARDCDQTEEVRSIARAPARHYPSRSEILLHGKYLEMQCAEKGEEPFLTSKTEWEQSR